MCVMDPTDQAEIEFDFLFHVKKVFFFFVFILCHKTETTLCPFHKREWR